MSFQVLLDIKKKIDNAVQISNLIEEAGRISDHCTQELLPQVEQYAKILDGKFTNPVIKDIIRSATRFNTKLREDQFLTQVATAVKITGEQANVLVSYLRDEKVAVIMADTLDTKHALAIQFINVAQYLTEFTRSLLIVIAELEVATRKSESVERSAASYIKQNMTPANISAYASVIGYFLSREKEKIITEIYNMPDIKVDEMILTTVRSTDGGAGVDPSGLSVLNIINPFAWFYAVGRVVSDLKLWWLRLQEDELNYLTVRYQQLLELQQNGQDSLQTQKLVTNYSNAIDEKRAKIKTLRRRLGDGND